ncbi:MAG: hypothetical protein ABIE74_09265 [Pseudomonadota bacterium]
MKKKDKHAVTQALMEIEKDIYNLLDLFEFYISERAFDRPIETLQEAVGDLRIVIGRILTSHYIHLDEEEESEFCKDLAEALVKASESVPHDNKKEEKHRQYLIRNILVSFEWAQEIKKELADDPIMQEVLVLDIPVLRPFNYDLTDKLSVVEKNKVHGRSEKKAVHTRKKKK